MFCIHVHVNVQYTEHRVFWFIWYTYCIWIHVLCVLSFTCSYMFSPLPFLHAGMVPVAPAPLFAPVANPAVIPSLFQVPPAGAPGNQSIFQRIVILMICFLECQNTCTCTLHLDILIDCFVCTVCTELNVFFPQIFHGL